jgi:hypothetical protein
LWPSQRSATVDAVFELSTLAPTAVQADDDKHDTPFKNANCDPVGWGVGCIAQFVPFHRSASVRPPLVDPTAKQAEAEVHETDDGAAPGLAPVGVG